MASQQLLEGNTERENIDALGQHHCLAGVAFPCFKNLTNDQLHELFMDIGNQDRQDYRDDDFSLFRGAHEAAGDGVDVELENIGHQHTGGHRHSQEDHCRELANAQFDAKKRFKELYYGGPKSLGSILTGCFLYALTLGGGFLAGALADEQGPPAWGFIFPVAAIALLLYELDRVALLLSRTQVEGRPLLRLLKSLTGPDNFYVQTLFACVDTFSRFSRAQFVGYLAMNYKDVEKVFAAVLEKAEAKDGKFNGLVAELMQAIGFHWLAILGFIIGPIVIQFSYMFLLVRNLNKEVRDLGSAENDSTEQMNVTDSLDDLGALMNWAMLVPAGRVLDLATIPPQLKTKADLERLWDRIRTRCRIVLTRNIPDGILQLNVQAWFLSLTIYNLSFPQRVMMMVNIVGASVGVLGDSVDLLVENRRYSAIVAFLMLFMLMPGFIRVGLAWTCPSGVAWPGMAEYSFKCMELLPEITNATWKSGTLPG
jgi:hypothetical protein